MRTVSFQQLQYMTRKFLRDYGENRAGTYTHPPKKNSRKMTRPKIYVFPDLNGISAFLNNERNTDLCQPRDFCALGINRGAHVVLAKKGEYTK